MILNKHIFQDELGYDEKEAHNTMSLLVTKCPTSTKQVKRTFIAHGHEVTARVSLTSVMAQDALAISLKLLANTSNKRINKERWTVIRDMAIKQINKGLI